MIFACMLVMLATCVATDFMMQLCREFNCVGILLNRRRKKQLPPDIAFVVIFMQVADPAWQTIIITVQTS